MFQAMLEAVGLAFGGIFQSILQKEDYDHREMKNIVIWFRV